MVIKSIHIAMIMLMLFCADIFAAAAGGGVEMDPSVGKVERISDGLFVSSLGKDLYVVMEKVDTVASKDKWHMYAEAQLKTKLPSGTAYAEYKDEGLDYFKSQLFLYEQGIARENSFEMWVAYVRYTPGGTPRTLFAMRDIADIEMAVTVSTKEEVPFTTHIGISRAWKYVLGGRPQHKNLSIKLHGFAGKIMSMIHPEKLYMFTAPAVRMRQILLEALPVEAVWVGDSKFYKDLEDKPEETRTHFFGVMGEDEKLKMKPYEKGEQVLVKKNSPITISKGARFLPFHWHMVDTKGETIFKLDCVTHAEYAMKAWWFKRSIEFAAENGTCAVTILLSGLSDAFDRAVSAGAGAAAGL